MTWTERVEKICAQRGLQLTPLRRRVLEILVQARAPIGAYAIIDQLARSQQRAVGPPTVYRTLDFLVENGFVIKIESRNAYALCDDPGHDHHGVLLICAGCGKTYEIESPKIDKLLGKTAASVGFELRSQVVELAGLCRRCHTPSSDGTRTPALI
jgi:Fur family zinc uptake transcriptional regulator